MRSLERSDNPSAIMPSYILTYLCKNATERSIRIRNIAQNSGNTTIARVVIETLQIKVLLSTVTVQDLLPETLHKGGTLSNALFFLLG